MGILAVKRFDDDWISDKQFMFVVLNSKSLMGHYYFSRDANNLQTLRKGFELHSSNYIEKSLLRWKRWNHYPGVEQSLQTAVPYL